MAKKREEKSLCLHSKIRGTHTSYMPLSILDWKDRVRVGEHHQICLLLLSSGTEEEVVAHLAFPSPTLLRVLFISFNQVQVLSWMEFSSSFNTLRLQERF
jgi:hypothetical protein